MVVDEDNVCSQEVARGGELFLGTGIGIIGIGIGLDWTGLEW